METGARDPSSNYQHTDPNTYVSLAEAISQSLPGDIIELGLGHHWETHLVIDKPLKLVCSPGGEDDNSRCVVELSGQLHISDRARCVVLCGLTIRRPRRVMKKMPFVLVNRSALYVSGYHRLMNMSCDMTSLVVFYCIGQ